jgi:hypothetical protein
MVHCTKVVQYKETEEALPLFGKASFLRKVFLILLIFKDF